MSKCAYQQFIYDTHTHAHSLTHTHINTSSCRRVNYIFFMAAGNLVRHCGHLLEIKMLLCVRLSRVAEEGREGAPSSPPAAP